MTGIVPIGAAVGLATAAGLAYAVYRDKAGDDPDVSEYTADDTSDDDWDSIPTTRTVSDTAESSTDEPLKHEEDEQGEDLDGDGDVDIDVTSTDDHAEYVEVPEGVVQMSGLTSITGVGPSLAERLGKAGYSDPEDVWLADDVDLLAVSGVGEHTLDEQIRPSLAEAAADDE